MNNARLAQIILHQNHDFAHKPDWKQVDFSELQRAMESEYWFKERDELLKMVGEPIPEPEPTPQAKPEAKPKPESTTQPEAKRKLTGITAYDLANKDIPDVKWIVPDLIPEGLTLLAGAPKIGKSFFAWNLALAVAEGGIALSEIRIDTPRNVTYMAMEDPEVLLQERLHLMCPEGVPNNVHILDDVLGTKFDNEGLELVGDYIQETESELLIVDTWGHVKPNPQIKSGTSYDNDYAAMIPVLRFTHERNIAVILVTHTTKGKDVDNPYNDIQGSAGMQAGCDSMLMITREQGNPMLRVMGRRILEAEYAMTLDDGIWKLEGDADEFKMHEEQRTLLTFIRDAGEEGIKQRALVDLTGRKQGNVSNSLKAMLENGIISRHGKQGAYYAAIYG